jgi:hypothetical protein
MEAQKPDDKYIRRMFNNGTNRLIIMFYLELARILAKQRNFKCDIAYKHFIGDDNKVVFCAFIKELKRGILDCPNRLISVSNTF